MRRLRATRMLALAVVVLALAAGSVAAVAATRGGDDGPRRETAQEQTVTPAPEAEAWRPALHTFSVLDWPWVEDKGLTVAFHWREAPDEDGARSELEAIAGRGRELGLEARWGRKVLELRPPVGADKGTAVHALLQEHGLTRALYAGDDTTDLDAFRGLDGCEVAVRVALASPESPPGLREAADLVLASPAELLQLLRLL